ncbi:MAG: magnesium transporter [Dehalococcoidia bacterium]|nr:magnesium transporter [Dehalococcoidia bacterium]
MSSPKSDSVQTISPSELEEIVVEVKKLIKDGDEHSAWERVRDLHPADVWTIVAALPRKSRNTLVQVMSADTAAWMLRQMNPVEASRVAARLGSRLLSFMLDQAPPRKALETLERLPTPLAREVAESLEVPLEDKGLLVQAHDTAGALMVIEFPSVTIDDRSEAAFDRLRDLKETRYKFTHVFVVDDDNRLAGQVSIVDLALARIETPIRELITPILGEVEAETPAAECARLRRHYNLTQLPVVENGQLIGVIPAEFLLTAVVEEDTRQMLRVASASRETADGPLSASIRARLPWLTVNLGTTFLAAATIALFESTLVQVVALVTFLPVVTGQGGIGGTQTLTLIVRSIAMGELAGVEARRLLTREALLGLLHGLWLGLLVAIIATIWKQNLGLALVLGVATVGSMVIAGSVGAGVPLFLRRIGVDPAVASAIIITTFTDVFGLLLLLGISSALVSLIV